MKNTKKIILATVAAFITTNAFAFDPESSLELTGQVGAYTKTDYTITQKFGDYYRSPKAKFVHEYDASGKEAIATELTTRDSVVDKITYGYSAAGRLAQTICTDSEGKVSWKISAEYDENGNKIDESEFNASDILMNRTIWKYNGRNVEESLYNADGALLSRSITKLDDKARKTEVALYSEDGALEQKIAYTYNDAGKLSEVVYSNKSGHQIRRIVYRFDASYAVTEKQTYNSENKLSVREIYKYDSTGNISKSMVYLVADKFGTTVNELSSISEYAYTYGAGTAQTADITATPAATDYDDVK